MPLLPAYLDLETRRVRITPYIRPNDASAPPCVGKYSVVRGVLFALYRIDDELCLRVGDDEYRVTADMHAMLFALIGLAAYKLVARLFRSTPASAGPVAKALPPVDPHYDAAMRELELKLGAGPRG